MIEKSHTKILIQEEVRGRHWHDPWWKGGEHSVRLSVRADTFGTKCSGKVTASNPHIFVNHTESWPLRDD